MSAASGFRPAQIQSVDELFASMTGRTRSGQLLTVSPEEIGRPSAPVPRLGDAETRLDLPPLPDLPGADADLQAQRTWMEEERRRLEAYTLNQLALIERRREEILSQQSEVQQALVLREQELHRQINILTARAETLQHREQDLAEREAQLNSKLDESAVIVENLDRLQVARTQFQTETESQRRELETMRVQADQLEDVIRSAQQQGQDWDQTLADRRVEWEQENAKLTERRKQLELRFLAVERAEDSIRRRTAELDELEARLQEELEERERDLVRRAAEIEQRRASIQKAEDGLRKRGGEIEDMKSKLELEISTNKVQSDSQLIALQKEWDERRKALEQAEAGLQRRAGELEEMRQRVDLETTDRTKEQELLAQRRAQLEQRQVAVERTERALKRRERELEDLELELRGEYERREQRLALHREEVEKLWKSLRLRQDRPAAAPEPKANDVPLSVRAE